MTEYLIIHLQKSSVAQFFFDGLNYSLPQDQVACLIEKGVLLTSGAQKSSYFYSQSEIASLIGDDDFLQELKLSYYGYGCHRCRKPFHWDGPPPSACPHCHTNTWNTYTLLYCCECHAFFEYYWHPLAGGNPYDRFPRCPACRSWHWCPAENERLKSLPPKEEAQAQAEAKRQQEVEAYTRLMEFRKQQELKKLGLRQSSPQAEEKGAAIPEAEAYYQSVDRKTTWLDKGARHVQLPGLLPHHSTPASQQPTSMSQQPTPASQYSTPAPQQPMAAPRRGILSVLRNWFRPRSS